MLCSTQKNIQLLNDFTAMAYEIKQGANEGQGIKILPRQIFQGFPMAVAQVKPGNTSNGLLDDIGQNVYSFYQAKEITKKYLTL